MIEYRKLKQDGHCSLCGEEIKKDTTVTTIVHFYHRSKNPKVNICRECAYKIFYAPELYNENSEVMN